MTADPSVTVWRCIWTDAGHFAPEWHDFRYQQAAEVLRDIKRDQGATAEVVALPTEGDE